ncbi:MAG: major facilitator superfamily 1 [Marmoricola sp.]|nr:major facilitator superfamily 1 [Marmoricola sp.]
MSAVLDPASVSSARRWSMLAVGVLAQGTSAITINGPAFLIPTLHRREGLSLVQAAFVAAAPTIGVMLTLIAWGYAVDRYGERFVLAAGLGGACLSGIVATQVHGTIPLAAALFVAGGFASSTSSASGRVVVGWFPANRRGLAMGIRQMAQPLGVGIAAISIAVLADKHGITTALVVPAIATGVALVAVVLVVLDPPRPERTLAESPNPYRNDFLWRVHGVSVLLVIPQFAVWTFGLVWLVDERGWSAGAAGALIAASQVPGALGRIAAGHVSDLVGSRMAPLRWVAVAAGITMLLLGLTAQSGWWIAVVLMVVATTVTVADNGLAFTAVAERAGPFWSGRALGVQNTAQFLTAAVAAPLVGAGITHWGYTAAFSLTALGPLIAVPLVPKDEGALPD